jgi:dihydroorotase
MNSFVDLYGRDATVEAAVRGGFGTVVVGPLEHPSDVRARLAQPADPRVRFLVAGALTKGLRGEEIADVGLLVAAGVSVLSNGGVPLKNARILRHVLEYAGRTGVPVFLRAADPDLEAGGIVREGPRASWLGLSAVPPEAEEIGITTVAALVRRTGTPVHLTHLWSSRGVDALRRARGEGLPITASTTAHHLALSDAMIDTTAYAGTCRFVPPLGDDADRKALVEALRDGTIDAVATDHKVIPLHLQDRELEIAEPGAPGLETAYDLVLGALGDEVLARKVLTSGPMGALVRGRAS